MPRVYTTPKKVLLTHERVLGQGSFGQAIAVRGRKGQLYCLKKVRLPANFKERATTLREVHMMRQTCAHPNVITFHDAWISDDQRCLHILMEYCSNGSLHSLIQRFAAERRKFEPAKVTHYAQELAGALRYCHDDLGIIHRDIKSDNVLIDELGTLKLADFGFARVFDATNNLNATICGSPLFMAPEVLMSEAYSFPADVWSMGCILFELMALESPWTLGETSRLAHTLAQRIRAGKIPFESLAYPPPLVDLVRWMLQRDPARRPTAAHIADHLEMRQPPAPLASVVLEAPTRPSSPITTHELAARFIQRSFRQSAGVATPPRPTAPVPSPEPPPEPVLEPSPPRVPTDRPCLAPTKPSRRAELSPRLESLAAPRGIVSVTPGLFPRVGKLRSPPLASPLAPAPLPVVPRPAWV